MAEKEKESERERGKEWESGSGVMKCLLNKFSVSLLCVHLISQLAFARE